MRRRPSGVWRLMSIPRIVPPAATPANATAADGTPVACPTPHFLSALYHRSIRLNVFFILKGLEDLRRSNACFAHALDCNSHALLGERNNRNRRASQAAE